MRKSYGDHSMPKTKEMKIFNQTELGGQSPEDKTKISSNDSALISDSNSSHCTGVGWF